MIIDKIQEHWWIILPILFYIFIFFGRRIEKYTDWKKKRSQKKKYQNYGKKYKDDIFNYSEYKEKILGTELTLFDLKERIDDINTKIIKGGGVEVSYLELWIMVNIYRENILKSETNSYFIDKKAIQNKLNIDPRILNEWIRKIQADPFIQKREVEAAFMLHHIRNNTFRKKHDDDSSIISTILLAKDYVLSTKDVYAIENENDQQKIIFETSDNVIVDDREVFESDTNNSIATQEKLSKQKPKINTDEIIKNAKKVTYEDDGSVKLETKDGIKTKMYTGTKFKKDIEINIEEDCLDISDIDVSFFAKRNNPNKEEIKFESALSQKSNKKPIDEQNKTLDTQKEGVKSSSVKKNHIQIGSPKLDSSKEMFNKTFEEFMKNDEKYFSDLMARYFMVGKGIIYRDEDTDILYIAAPHILKFITQSDLEEKILVDALFENHNIFLDKVAKNIFSKIKTGGINLMVDTLSRKKFTHKNNGKEEVYTFMIVEDGEWLINFEKSIKEGRMISSGRMSARRKVFIEQFLMAEI